MVTTLEDLSSRVRTRQELPAPAARRALRKAAGISLQNVADVCGVTRQAVATWETAGRTPRGQTLEAYVAVLRALRQAVAGDEK
jgi:DNA-binding transcriptional regulator YiaG